MRRLFLLSFLVPALALTASSEPESEGPVPSLHPAMRAGIDVGRGDDAGTAVAVEYRLMQHDLIDPFPHHDSASLGELLKIRVSYLSRGERLRLDELTLIRTLTLPPINTSAEKDLAWKLRVGAETIRDASCDHCVATLVEGGVGVAVQPFAKLALIPFATLDLEVGLAPRFANFIRLGLGPAGGIRVHLADTLAVLLHGKYRFQVLTPVHHTHAVGGEVRWRFQKHVALRIKGDHYPDGWEANTGILYYF